MELTQDHTAFFEHHGTGRVHTVALVVDDFAYAALDNLDATA